MKRILIFLFILVPFASVKADSPLTSTVFHTAYSDIPEVAAASTEGLTDKGLAFLTGNAPIDQKLALINALGWGNTTYVEAFQEELARLRKIDTAIFTAMKNVKSIEDEILGLDKLGKDDLTVLGYLQVMGDYFNVNKGYYACYHGFIKNSESYSHAMVLGLVIAQTYLESMQWCDVYNVMSQVNGDPSLSQNKMREEAVTLIFDYINLYAESCTDEGEGILAEGSYSVNDIYPINTEYYDVVDNNLILKEGIFKKMEQTKKSYADLYIVSVEDPVYDEEIDGTIITVKVGNKGKTASVETLLVMRSIDNVKTIDLKSNMDKDSKELLKHVQGEWNTEEEHQFFIIGDLVSPLKPGETTEVTFRLSGFWIYDPNIEIECIIDFPELIAEPDEKNNSLFHIRMG
jgi:hypothetical protein